MTAQGHPAAALPAAGVGDDPAGRRLPRLRARRPHHRHRSSRRSACPTAPGAAAAAGRAGPPGHQAVQPRPGHRQPHRGAGDQHHQDAAQRSAPVVPRHQRPAGRLPLLRLHRLPRRLRQRPRPARTRASTRSSATRASRSHDGPDDPARTSPGHPHPARVHPRDPDQPVHDLPHAPAQHVREHLPRLHHVGLRVRRAAHVAGEAAATRPRDRGARDPRPQPGRARRSRGKWGDLEFLQERLELNPKLKDTQFADYHGHGWNFRAVFKRDRKGTLLDKDGDAGVRRRPGEVREGRAPARRSTSTSGMQCVDCHFAQDAHGNGHIYGEVAAAIEIDCKDCHGTADALPDAAHLAARRPRPSGTRPVAAAQRRTAASASSGAAASSIQRSAHRPGAGMGDVAGQGLGRLRATPHYNAKAARAKLMSRGRRRTQAVGPGRARSSSRTATTR